MESNWRMNVPMLGWSEGPFAKIARIRTGIYAGYYLAQETFGSGRSNVVFFVVFDDLLNFAIVQGPYDGPFPSGFDVDPD